MKTDKVFISLTFLHFQEYQKIVDLITNCKLVIVVYLVDQNKSWKKEIKKWELLTEKAFISEKKKSVWEEGTLWVIARNGSVGWLKWMWFYNEIIRREEKNNGIDWIDLLSICSKQKKIDCNIPVRLKLVERNLSIINRSDSFISKINNGQKQFLKLHSCFDISENHNIIALCFITLGW